MEFTKDIQFSNVLRANKTSTITYSGNLYQKQSEVVTIVYGFGENWDYTTEQEMLKTENGFSAEIEMKNNFDTFNFCFRNGNYEWDNNESFNYISPIQPAILNTEKVEVSEVVEETKSEIDTDFIIEILDSLLEENISQVETVTEENISKQQILDDILSENTSPVQAPVLMEEFDMDKLVENILNPVINFEKVDEDEFENIVDFEKVESNVLNELKQGLNDSISNLGAEENSTVLAETKEDTALVPTKDTYLVSPRKLRKFYLFAKKIKLAFYKLFVSIPKLLYGNLGEDKNN